MTDNATSWWMLSGHLFQNVMLLMMGSAEELPQAPSERPKFIEDMSDAEAAAAVSGVCVRKRNSRRRCGRRCRRGVGGVGGGVGGVGEVWEVWEEVYVGGGVGGGVEGVGGGVRGRRWYNLCKFDGNLHTHTYHNYHSCLCQLVWRTLATHAT